MENWQDLKIFSKLKEKQSIRVMALGSSNTERFQAGAWWFDYVELGFKRKYSGNCGQFINCGVSGNTTRDVLARFDRDVSPYKPDLVILTLGVNDAHPKHELSDEEFEKNLLEIYNKIQSWGGEVIFQTYYSCDLSSLDEQFAKNILTRMQQIRDCAKKTNSLCNDNYTLWEFLQKENPMLYNLLKRDALHVNPIGNMVIGLNWLRQFKLSIAEENFVWCRDGLFAEELMHVLANKVK